MWITKSKQNEKLNNIRNVAPQSVAGLKSPDISKLVEIMSEKTQGHEITVIRHIMVKEKKEAYKHRFRHF